MTLVKNIRIRIKKFHQTDCLATTGQKYPAAELEIGKLEFNVGEEHQADSLNGIVSVAGNILPTDVYEVFG